MLLDVDAHELVLDGRRVPLTELEFEVMNYFSAHTGKMATRIALESEVWGNDYHGGSNVVDAGVKSLRKKLGERGDSLRPSMAAAIDCGSISPATRDNPNCVATHITPVALGRISQLSLPLPLNRRAEVQSAASWNGTDSLTLTICKRRTAALKPAVSICWRSAWDSLAPGPTCPHHRASSWVARRRRQNPICSKRACLQQLGSSSALARPRTNRAWNDARLSGWCACASALRRSVKLPDRQTRSGQSVAALYTSSLGRPLLAV